MKKYALNLTPFIITFVCIVAYKFIGSEVLSDGTLVEPFYLIPIGFLFFCIGIIGVFISVFLYLRKK